MEADVERMTDQTTTRAHAHLRCPGNIFGIHRFEPRYDERPSEPVSKLFNEGVRASAQTAADMIRGNTIRVYVGDVCVRCGLMTKREAQ